METNLLALVLASVSTLIVGFIWYSPKVFGTIWMKESRTSMEQMTGSNMVMIFVMSIIFAFLISFTLQFLVIHQYGVFSLVEGNVSDIQYIEFMKVHGSSFRTFKHGSLHGFFAGLLFALPVVGVNALFERKSWKYVLIAGGYWVISCMIMGGIICAME